MILVLPWLLYAAGGFCSSTSCKNKGNLKVIHTRVHSCALMLKKTLMNGSDHCMHFHSLIQRRVHSGRKSHGKKRRWVIENNREVLAVESLKRGTVVPCCTSKGGLIDVWCLGTSTTARQAISATMYICTSCYGAGMAPVDIRT